MERFWDKVEKTDECWLWTAYLNRDGYGMFRLDGRSQRAHRVAYELANGPIPDGVQLDHLCRNRACVNPEHLDLVTSAENTHRGETGRHQVVKSHCPRGHMYDEANTYVEKRKGGTVHRVCRACKRDQKRKTS